MQILNQGPLAILGSIGNKFSRSSTKEASILVAQEIHPKVGNLSFCLIQV